MISAVQGHLCKSISFRASKFARSNRSNSTSTPKSSWASATIMTHKYRYMSTASPVVEAHELRRPYEPSQVETEWRSKWQCSAAKNIDYNKKKNLSQSSLSGPSKKKYYTLSMFPYPSGNLHIGHARVYTISDMLSRAHKLAQFDVMHPMGWDSFGLPAENAAVERGINPKSWTESNIQQMKSQMLSLGLEFDWDREVSTCSPSYYKWTQWIFTKLYEAGLAYQKKSYVNWDPVDLTVLANEQVDAQGKSWRSGAIVEQKLMKQWYLKITDYAEPLLNDLDSLDNWPERVKKMQQEWIGKSSGVTIRFKVDIKRPYAPMNKPTKTFIEVFTTRPDTMLGCTYLVLAPEHPLVSEIVDPKLRDAYEMFKNDALKTGTIDRKDAKKSKRGMDIGITATHPVTGIPLPIYIADYVLLDYATGAVMGVPAHDPRDFEFAKQHNISIVQVVESSDLTSEEREKRIADQRKQGILFPSTEKLPYLKTGEGTRMINCGTFYSGMTTTEASEKMLERGSDFIKRQTMYNLRDWLVSRQRYWGAPIPIIHCTSCGTVPVPEQDLPVELPVSGVEFKGKGSPLANMAEFVNCKCPKCGSDAKRETDTMDTFVDSSWYFMRYPDANNIKEIFSKELVNKWLPVDVYIGGVEHAILHLLYARFINKFMYDQGYIPNSEPFSTLRTQGMVHGKTFRQMGSQRVVKPELVEERAEAAFLKETGEELEISWEKMSKSKYNGVDPIQVVKEYGADTIRLFLLFKAPVDQVLDWDTNQIIGQLRWIRRIWSLIQHVKLYQMHRIWVKSQKFSTPEEATQHSHGIVPIEKFEFKVQDLQNKVHSTIYSVTNSVFTTHSFNVAIAKLMELSNELGDIARIGNEHFGRTFPENKLVESSVYEHGLRSLILMLAPMAPHFASEAWVLLNSEIVGSQIEKPSLEAGDVWAQQWPSFNPEYLNAVLDKDAKIQMAVHLGGKHRATIDVPRSIDNESLKQFILESPALQKYLQGRQVVKFVHVESKNMINLVVV